MRLIGNVSAAIEPQKPLNKYSICSTVFALAPLHTELTLINFLSEYCHGGKLLSR